MGVFFTVTFTWTWLIWSVLILISRGIISLPEEILTNIKLPIMICGVFGPLIGALAACRKEQGKGSTFSFFRDFLNVALGWKTYLYSFIILVPCCVIPWFLPELTGASRLPMVYPSLWFFFPYLLLMILFGGGQEEFGWRGFALSRMEKSLGLWRSNILLGCIWGCWHIPLWFIPGTNQSYMPFTGFLILTISWSFIFSWIKKISGGNLFTCLFVHGLSNAISPFFPTTIMEKDVFQTRFWIRVVLTFSVGIIITFLRLKNESRDRRFNMIPLPEADHK